MKRTTIDSSLLPNMWLWWETTKGRFWLDCQTGKKQNSLPNVTFDRKYALDAKNIIINSGSKYYRAYAKYHEDIDMLELAAVTIPTTRKEEPKEWSYAGDVLFLSKDKKIYNSNGTVQERNFLLYDNHCTSVPSYFFSMFTRLSSSPNVVNEFRKFLGSDTYTIGNGRVISVEYTWHIQDWFNKQTTGKPKGKGKAHNLVNKLTAIELSDASLFGEKYPVTEMIDEYYSYYKKYCTGIIYFERLSDGWSVLRMFDRPVHGELSERERMYIHDNGENRLTTPCNGSWIPSKQSNPWNSSAYRFVNKDEAIAKCNRLKYIMPVVNDIESTKKFKSCLISALRFPEIEQLSKLGYAKFARDIASGNMQKADITRHFGGYYNAKSKNLLKKIGLTKHQLDKHMEAHPKLIYNNASTIHKMREFFGDDFAHIDNATFDKYYDAFEELNRVYYYRSSLKGRCEDLHLDYKKFVRNMVRLGEKNQNIYRIIVDTMNQYSFLVLGTQPTIDWYFDSCSDVVRVHDAVTALKVQQDAERRAAFDKTEAERRKAEEEKRKKIDEIRKQYEYEDDNFIIRLPRNGTEITNEGINQSICIGGYVSDHANGRTNLFFLREKSEPDVPFYAIEMGNDKVVRQIHGYCNKWLGNNPEAIPTVVRWLRKNGIKCNEHILTCTAKGYGSTAEHCEMPIVD